MPSDYTASSGALKLKGSAGVTKKKKKKPKVPGESSSTSKAISKSVQSKDEAESSSTSIQKVSGEGKGKEVASNEIAPKNHVAKTEAEIRFEENRRKRLEDRLKREGGKTHKERVEELNRYLSKLSEHHDMPRIGPG